MFWIWTKLKVSLILIFGAVIFKGVADKDVYVCESRYSARQKAFKKIKVNVKS